MHMHRLLLILFLLSPCASAAYWGRTIGGAAINEVDRQRRKERQVVTVVQPQVVHTYTYQVPGETLEQQTRDIMYTSILLDNDPRYAGALIRHLKSQGNPDWPRLYERFIGLVPDGTVDMPAIPPLVREAGMSESDWQSIEAGYYHRKQQEQMDRYHAELSAARTVAQGWTSRLVSATDGRSDPGVDAATAERAEQIRLDILYVEKVFENLPKYEPHAAVLMYSLVDRGAPEGEALLTRHAELRPDADIERFRRYRSVDVHRAREGLAKLVDDDDAIFRELEAAEEESSR